MSQGYYRSPTVFGSTVVFISEDDLWSVPLTGGMARRLTAGVGRFARAQFSPDGKWLAVNAAEEGSLDVYVMPADGGELKRLTYLGGGRLQDSPISGWLNQDTIGFVTNSFSGQFQPEAFTISTQGGHPKPLQLGPCVHFAISSHGVLIERNSHRPDPAHWKRYRGGTAGKIWIADQIDGEFRPLLQLDSNFSKPIWVGERIYFLSDHEGIGNIYSCDKSGQNITRHTNHQDYYARNISSDGKTIVYHAGADLYAYDLKSQKQRRIEIEYASQRTQRQRKFVPTADYLESAHLDEKGEKITITSRGQAHAMKIFDGPISTVTAKGARHRLSTFLKGGDRIVTLVDDVGEERFSIFDAKTGELQKQLPQLDLGRALFLKASPTEDQVLLANHRNELIWVDLKSEKMQTLDRNEHLMMGDFNWSPDGRWVAYSKSKTWNIANIFLAEIATGKTTQVTPDFFEDSSPCFDPEGRYLYFLSQRDLNPVYDSIQFELSFPKVKVPCLVTLKKDLLSPFLCPPEEAKEEAKKEDGPSKNAESSEKEKKVKNLEVDFDRITERIVAFPVPTANYSRILATESKVFFISFPVEGALGGNWLPDVPEAKGKLEVYDLKNLKFDPWIQGISAAELSGNGKKMLLRIGKKLRWLDAMTKPDEAAASDANPRKSGWIDLNRCKTLIEPTSEWKQMLREVWRLQRDHFWDEKMSQINWVSVYKLYAPLVDRVSCRSEFGDLVWEMQGELGTSHAYDIGGDYRAIPRYSVGRLGAEFAWSEQENSYIIKRFYEGDLWSAHEASPLRAPGVNLNVGDCLLAIDGKVLDQNTSPFQLLFNKAQSEVWLEVRKRGESQSRLVHVKTLNDEYLGRYRSWVEKNRRYVEMKTQGKVGYIHIPDMGAFGFSEFHRHFLRDYNKDGIIVDVRYNGGGHVSQLLLEKLARPRMGADYSRWFGVFPFPSESPAGPLVAITNEYAGSDGDIFSHSFKLRELGPLIGKRTWGGVVGIWPRHRLVDGGVTTQPEFSHWFKDVEWQVENYGTDPTIDVEFAPHHYRRDEDPQLDRALTEMKKLIESRPPLRPTFNHFPDRSFAPKKFDN